MHLTYIVVDTESTGGDRLRGVKENKELVPPPQPGVLKTRPESCQKESEAESLKEKEDGDVD